MSLSTYDHPLPTTTDFNDDAIAIDPADCGCTDCLTGQALPIDSAPSLEEALIMEHFHPAIRRPVINRTSHNLFACCAARARTDQSFAEHDMRRDFAFFLTDRFPMGPVGTTVERIPTH